MSNIITITRENGGRYCTAKIELRDRNGVTELSITGEAGRVVTERKARSEALAYWVSFFEDDWNAIKEMNERCGTRFRSPRSAAKFVLDTDGDFHGLDVEISDGRAYVGECFGHIREELAEWFPELVPLLPWHLNGTKAKCVHQALQGRTYQTDPGHVCPACGTKLGHAWYTWKLPARVLARVEALRALS
jgi:hypothetical protein